MSEIINWPGQLARTPEGVVFSVEFEFTSGTACPDQNGYRIEDCTPLVFSSEQRPPLDDTYQKLTFSTREIWEWLRSFSEDVISDRLIYCNHLLKMVEDKDLADEMRMYILKKSFAKGCLKEAISSLAIGKHPQWDMYRWKYMLAVPPTHDDSIYQLPPAYLHWFHHRTHKQSRALLYYHAWKNQLPLWTASEAAENPLQVHADFDEALARIIFEGAYLRSRTELFPDCTPKDFVTLLSDEVDVYSHTEFLLRQYKQKHDI